MAGINHRMATRQSLRRGVTWVLAIALVVSLGLIGAVALNPPETTDPYTEFYLLGPDGNATGYPTSLSAGESGTVIAGVANHEHEPVTYTMRVSWNGSETNRTTLTVADDQTIERRLSVVAPAEPGQYRVRFELYKTRDVSGEPYRYARLWITVRR